jgi:hypothetical protein
VTRSGGDFDRWDIEARASVMGSVRTRLAVEEHGGGRQLVRLRCWPCWSTVGAVTVATVLALAAAAAVSGAALAATLLGAVTMALVLRTVVEWAAAAASVRRAFEGPLRAPAVEPALVPVDERVGA